MDPIATKEIRIFKAWVTSGRERSSFSPHVELLLGRAFTSYQSVLFFCLVSITVQLQV